MDLETVASYLTGEVVMVTGAGGSIGSELARQIAAVQPAKLILLGHGENSIFEIHQELAAATLVQLVPVIADIRDRAEMDRVFAQHRPSIVFHAAAHKHVPLMEAYPHEAVTNNVLGTRVVASLALQHGVRRFVLISSDKAVNPSSVMGTTKRMAELILQALNQEARASGRPTCFSTVRLGNVLGSRGSVVPLMRQQIARGGPVTITHPDMVRYFMTIPEAVQLVLQAGAIAVPGSTQVLDMGDPVRIEQMALDLIRLSGLVPDQDIPIRYTGIRPGEKLYEEPLTAAEGVAATRLERIFLAPSEQVDTDQVWRWVAGVIDAAHSGEAGAIRKILEEAVGTYEPARIPDALVSTPAAAAETPADRVPVVDRPSVFSPARARSMRRTRAF
jgi:FlaA1/EpsC-like NDP-sugar epimerase